MSKIIIYNVKKLTKEECILPNYVTFLRWNDIDVTSSDSIKKYIESKNNTAILAIIENVKIAQALITSLLNIENLDRKDIMFITTSKVNIPVGRYTGINYAIVNLNNGYHFLKNYIENLIDINNNNNNNNKLDVSNSKLSPKALREKYDLTLRDIEILSDHKWTNSVICNIENGKESKEKTSKYFNDLQCIVSNSNLNDALLKKQDYVIIGLQKAMNIVSKQIARDTGISETAISKAKQDIDSGNNFAIRQYLSKTSYNNIDVDTKIICNYIKECTSVNNITLNDVYDILNSNNGLLIKYDKCEFYSRIMNGDLDTQTAINTLFASNMIDGEKTNLINDGLIVEEIDDNNYDDADYNVIIDDSNNDIANKEIKTSLQIEKQTSETFGIAEALKQINTGLAVTNDKLNAENKVLIMKDNKPTICLIKYEPVEFDSTILLEDKWYIKK